MALKAGSVLPLPDLACMGHIAKVGDAKLGTKGVYHNVPVEVKGKFAGRDGVFFFIFEPRWFGASFDPDELKGEFDDKGRPMKYRLYMAYINGESRPSTLAAILGDDFDKFAAELTTEDPTPQEIAEKLREFFVGREVMYVMKQRKDEDTGTLMDQYNIQSFYAATVENIKYLQEQANNPKRKTELVVTWDED